MQRRAAVLSLLLMACGAEEAPIDPADSAPIVGVLELPISHNNGATVPSGAPRIEMTLDELRVDGTKVIDLERGTGRVPAAELDDHAIPKLRDRVRGTQAALWVNANVPYATLAEVLSTLSAAGIRELYFAVRREPSNPDVGWMRIARWQVVPHGEDAVRFTGGTPLPWSAFTDSWRDVYTACRAGQYIDCDGTGRNIAPGGELQTVLWTRGSGMRVTFMQVAAPDAGVPEPAPRRRGPALIEGVRAPPPQEAEEDLGPPAVQGSFSFRQQESVAPESAISAAVRPVCATQSCQLVVVADATTASMRVLSLLGAVYANGFSEPQIAFRLAEGQ